MKKLFILTFVLLLINISAQDSTRSEAFRRNLPEGKSTLNKPKYPSYPLLTGFLLLKEANDGDPFAQHELGIRYLLGQGFPADTAKAIYWIKKAVTKNVPAAKFNYGILLYNGIGVNWNPFEAYKNFKSAAKSGMPEGEYAYGISLTDNLVVNRNMAAAYKWIKKAAEENYKPAIKTLKSMNEQGYNILDTDSSNSDTTHNFVNSANSSIINQKFELDYLDFADDTLSPEKEKQVVEKLLTKDKNELKQALGIADVKFDKSVKDTSAMGLVKYAVSNGSPEALLIAGMAYEKGIAVKKDIIEAAFRYVRSYRMGSQKAAMRLLRLIKNDSFFKLLKERVDKEDPNAMYTWAGLVALGFDFQLTDEQAYELLEKAAKMNHIYSIIEIGLNYYNGTLVKQDKQKAMEYWQKAAKLGSREAEVRLAFAKITEEKNTDKSKQINVLHRATDQGSVLAQAALGYCYEKGIGVKKDKAKAVYLYRQAAFRGNESAYNSMKRMYDEIRPNDPEFVIYE